MYLCRLNSFVLTIILLCGTYFCSGKTISVHTVFSSLKQHYIQELVNVVQHELKLQTTGTLVIFGDYTKTYSDREAILLSSTQQKDFYVPIRLIRKNVTAQNENSLPPTVMKMTSPTDICLLYEERKPPYSIVEYLKLTLKHLRGTFSRCKFVFPESHDVLDRMMKNRSSKYLRNVVFLSNKNESNLKYFCPFCSNNGDHTYPKVKLDNNSGVSIFPNLRVNLNEGKLPCSTCRIILYPANQLIFEYLNATVDSTNEKYPWITQMISLKPRQCSFLHTQCVYSQPYISEKMVFVTKPKMEYFNSFKKFRFIFSVETWIIFLLTLTAVTSFVSQMFNTEMVSLVVVKYTLYPLLQFGISIPEGKEPKYFLLLWSFIAGAVLGVAISAKITQFMVIPSYAWMPSNFEELVNSNYDVNPFHLSQYGFWSHFDINNTVHQSLLMKAFKTEGNIKYDPVESKCAAGSLCTLHRLFYIKCMEDLAVTKHDMACLYFLELTSYEMSHKFLNAIGESTLLLHTKDTTSEKFVGYMVYYFPSFTEEVVNFVPRMQQGNIWTKTNKFSAYAKRVVNLLNERNNLEKFEEVMNSHDPKPLKFNQVNVAFYLLAFLLSVSVAIALHELQMIN